ncbi:MAG: phytoene desaturase family protein [Culicoidibacterales bacterium]
MVKKSHVAIIGGGIAGMMSALILEKKGYDVTIFEKKEQLGGRLTYKSNGTYKIDRGPTAMLLPHMHREIFTLAGLDFDDLTIERCDPAITINFANGKQFIKSSDTERQKNYFAVHYPSEFVGFEHYLADMRNLYPRVEKLFFKKSLPNLKSITDKKMIAILSDMKLYRSTRSFLKNYFTNDQILDAYSLQTLFVGGGPSVAQSLYSLVGFSEHEHGVWYLQGGYASLVEYLTQKLEHRGITIRYEQTIIGMTYDKKTITHLETETQKFSCDQVISNTEYPFIAELLKQKSKTYRPSNGCVTIYLGINQRYGHKPVHSFYLPNDFAMILTKMFKQKQLAATPVIYVFNPSVIDESLAPSGHSSLYVLVPVPSQTVGINWDDESFKNQFVEMVLTMLEYQKFTGLKAAIQWQEVITPADCEREGLYKGGSYGIAPHFSQSGPFRPQATVKPFTNAYAVGASVHPGDGVPIVMQSARLACEELVKKDEENASKSSLF